MRYMLRTLVSPIAVALALTGISLPNAAQGQAYPIDCAILLCLSGGWPASVPCTLARAEFTRRITPWPIEPPLQIWRCPMGASFETDRGLNNSGRIVEVFSKTSHNRLFQSFQANDFDFPAVSKDSIWNSPGPGRDLVSAEYALRLVKQRADIDISGTEFNFVRSIRVFHVRYARQYDSGRDEDCNRSATVLRGTYGTQGNFYWQRASVAALPAAHVGLERWGDYCPSIHHRSVFVDWRDYEGNYGFEQVNY